MKTSLSSLLGLAGCFVVTVTSAEQPGRGGAGHSRPAKPKQLICKALPYDTDKDGIPDGCDRCPDTAKGTVVGVDGCPLVVVPPVCWGDTKPPTINESDGSGWSIFPRGRLVDDGSGKSKWVLTASIYAGVGDACETGRFAGILQPYWGETKLAVVACKGVPWTTQANKWNTRSGFFNCAAELKLPLGVAPAEAAKQKPVNLEFALWAADGAGNSSGRTLADGAGKPFSAGFSCSFAGGAAKCVQTGIPGWLKPCYAGLADKVPSVSWSPPKVSVEVKQKKKTLVAMAKPTVMISIDTLTVQALVPPGCSFGGDASVEAVVTSDDGRLVKMFATEANSDGCLLTKKSASPSGIELKLACKGIADQVIPVTATTKFSYKILIRAKNSVGNTTQKVIEGKVSPPPTL